MSPSDSEAPTPAPEQHALVPAQRRPIAVDAMGGDRAPAVVIEGAAHAVRQGHGPLLLVGDSQRIQPELDRYPGLSDQITLVHADEIIGMAEPPASAARNKRSSSIHVGYQCVRDGRASAFVSAGNTGAMMSVGLLILHRLASCDRPAIATSLPTAKGPVVLLDIGANVDCRAAYLAQFALMGAAYAQAVHQIERPRVGLLSNGSEPTKGTEILREAHRLLCESDLQYVGFIEGRQLPQGDLDVVVTDGFVGNIALKLSEGIGQAFFDTFKEVLRKDWLGQIGAYFIRRSLRRIQAQMDWTQIGGAPLLGLRGTAIVAHGGSNAQAIANAIRTARQLEPLNLPERIEQGLQNLGISAKTTATSELPLNRNSGDFEREDL